MTTEQRVRKSVPWYKVFPQFAPMDGADTLTDKWKPLEADKPLIPRIDENYVFPPEPTQVLVNVLSLRGNNPVWIKGLSGTGKSTLIRQVCARLRIPLYEIEGSASLTLKTLLGTTAAGDGKTFFEERLLLKWLRGGGVLCVHEYDTLDPLLVNALKPIMEEPPHYNVPELSERVEGHPDCKVVVTCNTWGSGDQTGLFGANTHKQSDADLRRFCAFIEVDYLPVDVEVKMLQQIFSLEAPGDIEQARQVVTFAGAVRAAFRKGDSDFTLSPAQLINWLRLTLKMKCGFRKAAEYAFINKLTQQTREAVVQMLDAVYAVQPTTTTTTTP